MQNLERLKHFLPRISSKNFKISVPCLVFSYNPHISKELLPYSIIDNASAFSCVF